MSKHEPPQQTRHDSAVNERLQEPFVAGAVDRGMMDGSRGAFKRESRIAAVGSAVQPALSGTYMHPIPPPKGDRW